MIIVGYPINGINGTDLLEYQYRAYAFMVPITELALINRHITITLDRNPTE